MPQALLRLPPSPSPLLARALAFAVMIAIAACAPKTPNYDYAKEPDPRTVDLVLGVGDVIAINVWDNTNLNTEATIRPDGTITMPLIGDVKAAGQTTSTLKDHIKAQLQNFIKVQNS